MVAQDESERSEWVDKFRNTQMNLGEVIQTTMIQRQALWAIPPAAQGQQRPQQQGASQPPRQNQAPRMRAGGKGGKDKGGGKGGGRGGGKGSGTAVKMEDKFRDGKSVCMQQQFPPQKISSRS